MRITQGKLKAATTPLEQSRPLAAALSARKPDNTNRLFELGRSEFWLGFVRWRRRNLDRALTHFLAYLDIGEQLVKLRRQRGLGGRCSTRTATSHIVLQERGDLAAALERFRASLTIDQRLLGAAPANRSLTRSVALSHNAIARWVA